MGPASGWTDGIHPLPSEVSMSNSRNSCFPLLLFAAGVLGCKDGNAAVNPISRNAEMEASMVAAGSLPTKNSLLSRTTFMPSGKDDKIDIKRKTDDWDISIKSRPGFDLAVQKIVFPVGSSSGWHSHPGPVFIQIVYGTITFYEEDDPTCSPIVRTAGQSYLDLGLHAHMAVNQSA